MEMLSKCHLIYAPGFFGNGCHFFEGLVFPSHWFQGGGFAVSLLHEGQLLCDFSSAKWLFYFSHESNHHSLSYFLGNSKKRLIWLRWIGKSDGKTFKRRLSWEGPKVNLEAVIVLGEWAIRWATQHSLSQKSRTHPVAKKLGILLGLP